MDDSWPGVLTGQGCFPKAPSLNLVLWLAGAPGKVGTLFLMLWASGSPQENPSRFSCGVTQAPTPESYSVLLLQSRKPSLGPKYSDGLLLLEELVRWVVLGKW